MANRRAKQSEILDSGVLVEDRCYYCGSCVAILQIQSMDVTIFLQRRHMGSAALGLIC